MDLSTLVDWITGGWWSYPVLTATIAGSTVFTPLPSEGAMVTAMSLAGDDRLDLTLVCVSTTLGSALGDLLAYGVGGLLRQRARSRAERSKRAKAALHWVESHEQTWGPGLIVAGRYVPGGATAVGISAGVLAYPFRRFVLFAGLGSVIWTAYGLMLTFVGQSVFPDNTWGSLAVAIGLVGVMSGSLNLWRFLRHRRRRGRGGPPLDG